jgi:arginyl-tRNA synthetase
MAAALYRKRHWPFEEMTYVVGGEQKLHFEQLFKALEMLGHEWAANCHHVDFGVLLFKQADGKWAKTSTRRGTSILLEQVLDEAIASVREIMQAKNPELASSPDGEAVAQAVGVGAVVFNDLKNGRRNNVKFDWDAVLDFEGESGPYMLYQYVRMGSVTDKFREAWGEPAFESGDAALLKLDEEWRILRLLADFPDAIAKASKEYEPSVVARYLVDLAGATSTWWAATRDTRIVGEDHDLSLARVRLVNAIRTTLAKGLNLLGMTPVERM